MYQDEGFHLPELIIESVIRDGFLNLQAKPDIIDNLFAQLNRNYTKDKYGTAELTKIKTLITQDLPVVYSYHEVDSRAPCFSIMIGSDPEEVKRAHLDDMYGQTDEEITDSVELEALVVADPVPVVSYNQISGLVIVDDSVDMTPVYKGFIYVDASDAEFEVIDGISNITGMKGFLVSKGSDVDVSSPGKIKSPLNYTSSEVRGVTSNVSLIIGVHSKNALTTKYLYLLLKYFILSRKHDIISRGLYKISFSGSDFNKDLEFLGDQVTTRFLTVTGDIDDTWNSSQVDLIDAVVVNGTPGE